MSRKRRLKKWFRKLDPWNKRSWYEVSTRLKNYFSVETVKPSTRPPWKLMGIIHGISTTTAAP